MISRSRRFIFVHIPKTAGNSIQLAIEPYCEDTLAFNKKQQQYNDTQGSVQRFDVRMADLNLRKHATVSQLFHAWNSESLGPWHKYYKFTCVRNPWDRLVSYYFSPHSGRTTFDKENFRVLIEKMAKKPQTDFFRIDGHVEVNYFVRFECLNEDMKRLGKQLGLDIELPHVNTSDRRPYQEYYDSSTKNLVSRLYREEIGLLGYMFESGSTAAAA